VSGFALQQRQHGLVASVHTVEVADGEGAAVREKARAGPASGDFHGFV
jgi:hypothetical protein